MKHHLKINSVGKVLGLLFIALCFFICCTNNYKNLPVENYYGEKFSGSDKCQNCHEEIYESFQHTAHPFASAKADISNMKGNFSPPGNNFKFNYFERVYMENRDSGFYQVAVHHNTPGELHRFDIIIGSGIRGQTYLYWEGDKLFQLPVSYYTPTNSWSSSPGYSDYNIQFNRPITARCMECHATYAQAKDPNNIATNHYDKAKVILGVECEGCHGAAAKHVAYQQEHPDDKKAMYILNPGKLSRQRQLDLCGVCHSGLQTNLQPSYSYIPGDTLSKYFTLDNNASNPKNLDVHGNKFALLYSSKCFMQSAEMTCSTCHNTHANERNNLQLFSQKCMGCHNDVKVKFCSTTSASKKELMTNCIDCHMPEKASLSLTVRLQDDTKVTPATLRTHKIGIYPDDSKKILSFIKQHAYSHAAN